MNPERIFFLVTLVFFSCSPAKTNNYKIKLAEDRSVYFYKEDSPFINLSLLGDYKFQPYKTKYFRDIDSRFIKYSTADFNNKKPTILYAAHTYVQPFYSTICVQYKDCKLDSNLIMNLQQELKINLKASFDKIEKIKCGTKDAYKIKYQVTNSLTKIYCSNTEYFFANKNTVYRLFLWTTNSDDHVISNEAEYIIKEARFN